MTSTDKQGVPQPTRANDNRHPPIPLPKGGLRTNAEEAQWLADTVTMRVNEMLAAAGVNAKAAPNGLAELFLLSLNSASKRGVRRG